MIIIYHANCADGFCSAWIAHKLYGNTATYIPAHYGEQPVDVAGQDVMILDFSYKAPVLEKMINDAKSIILLDHHKTAQMELEPLIQKYASNPNVVIKFDMNRSGARITWETLFPNHTAHWLVDYTEDRDLWHWWLPCSKAVNSAISSYKQDFETWDRLLLSVMINEGNAIERYQNQLVDRISANAHKIELAGHTVLAANTTVLHSEVADKLAEGNPFGVAWFVNEHGERIWSLRSKDGGIDVSKIAAKFGGGGHRNAAGFKGEYK